MSDDDTRLLTASQAGDVTAFGQLIERYHNLVCAIAYAKTGDRVASEDIAQETFLAAWRGIHGLRDADKLRAWLCGIARNRASKSLRQRRHDDITEHEGELAGDAGPLDAMLTKELETTVWAALSKLPETYREPLVLFYREQQSIKEVAHGLGLTEETAKQRLSRGRKQLEEHMNGLVERTLQAGRPRKAAAAAVLAAIIAMQTPSAAAAVPSTTRRLALGVGAGVIGIVVAIVLFTRSSRSEVRPAVPPTPDVAALQRAHEAWRKGNPGGTHCELGGTVARADGTPIGGALIALLAHNIPSFDPVIVQSDAAGRWRAPLAGGTYNVSISAPGQRALSYVTACAKPETASVMTTGGGTLRGTISDSGGGPIATATVLLSDPQRPTELFVARTGTDGSYELTATPGLYMAVFVHPEYTLDVRPVTLGPAGAREDATLLPGGAVEGVVVDVRGAPIAGAKVSSLAPRGLSADTPLRWQLAAFYGAIMPVTTDANGRFAIRGLPPGNTELVARAATLASAPLPLALTLAETKHDVTLVAAPARTLSGFVVDGGSGFAGAQVVAIREDGAIVQPMVATTDGAGYFALTGLAPGPYRVAAIALGYVAAVAEPIVVGDRDRTDTVLALARGVTLRGRAEPGAHVKLLATSKSVVDYMRAAFTRAEVDAHGNFTFAAVAPGDYVLSASTFDRRGERAVRVGTSASTVDIELAPRLAISGEVVDDKGTKLAGVIVAATPARNADPLATTHTTVRTDEQGAFRIVGVASGSHQLRVYGASGQRAWAEGKRPFEGKRVTPGEHTTLTVATGGARISGVVVGADDQPVADAWIDIRARGAHRSPGLFPAAPIVTDARGRFSVDGVFGDELVIEASGPDGRMRAAVVAAPSTHVTLALRPLSTLELAVTKDGAPVAFEARLEDRATRATRTATGVAGAASLQVMAGDHDLVVTSAAGYARQPITIGPTPTPLAISLTAWSSVRGRIVGTDGAAWADASIFVDESLEPTRVKTDANGMFTIDRMVAGANELSLIHPTRRDDLSSLALTLAPGQSLDLGTIEARGLPMTTSSTSADLGLAFYVAPAPPTSAQLAAVAADPMSASRGGGDPGAALWIASVAANSPGARAGLQPGDRVVGVGLSRIASGRAAVDMMMSLASPWRSKGRAVTWTVLRDGRERTLDVLVR